MKRTGIFAGTFDPIHLGHTSFMERSLEQHSLDMVLILIEKQPHFKTCLASYEHRRAMVELAVAQNPKISIYETDCDDFPISHCLPKIRVEQPDATLFLLIGADVVTHIDQWPGVTTLLKNVSLIIGDRTQNNDYSTVSSVKVRENLKTLKEKSALHPDVYDYITQNKLYQ